MENATKALLIAAAVLITIAIIAFGVNLLGAAGDSSSEAGKVSNQLKNTTGTKANSVVESITKLK